MSKAEEIVLLAEAHGFEFITFRGEARVWGAWKNPHVAAMVLYAQADVSSYLIETRSPGAGVLAELWESDSNLRDRFHAIEALDDFASDQAVRILCAALGYPGYRVSDSI